MFLAGEEVPLLPVGGKKGLISERTRAGLAQARDQGRVLGRPRVLTDEQLATARARKAGGAGVSEISRELGVARSTLGRYLGR
jgi:putative DNA-invertase from lambdoid prophage Rac